jgi:two-component system phosphate regulon response regulator PhoB
MSVAMAAEFRPADFRVLVIEDDPDLSELVVHNLDTAGYGVRAAQAALEGLAAVEAFDPHLVILDLMLPDLPGTEVCRRIRSEHGGEGPIIIMVTAKGEEIDRVVGFEVGADDYVVKPFSVRELVLRVNASLRGRHRRPQIAIVPNSNQRRRLRSGPLTVDLDGARVFVEGSEIQVSNLERRLLIYVLEGRGRVRSRDDLLEDVWGYQPGVSTRTVDTHVKRLRDKLGAAADLIETVRGVGYRLSDAHPVVEEEMDEAKA